MTLLLAVLIAVLATVVAFTIVDRTNARRLPVRVVARIRRRR